MGVNLNEISILVSMGQLYVGPALDIALSAAHKLKDEYGIYAYVEIDNSTISNPHRELISYWSAAIMVRDRIVYIDDGTDTLDENGIVEAIIDAVLGIYSERDVSNKLSIIDDQAKPQSLPGEIINIELI